MARTASTPKPEETGAALLAEINAKIVGFRERDKGLLAEQIVFERAGVVPKEPRPGPDARQRAAEMLNGYARPADGEPTDGEKLHALLVERAAIKIAVETLGKKETQARILALNELMQQTGADWQAIVRRRVDAILMLHRVNNEAAAFRQKLWAKAGMDPQLLLDSRAPIFAATLAGDFYTFLEGARAAGIVTRQEIAAASEVAQQ